MLNQQLPQLRVSFGDASEDIPESCVIPNVCMQFNFTMKRTYVPDSYRPRKALLRRCLGEFQFYSPTAPSDEMRDALQRRNDVDIIGVPLNSPAYTHFAHFIMEFVRRLAVPASLFLRPEPPRARWMCPGPAGALVPCANPGAIGVLKTRVVLSKDVLLNPRSWNSQFFAMLLGGTPARPRNVYLVPAKQPLHCFRSLLTSRQLADTAIPKRDSLFRAAGVSRKRISTCRPRIVVIVRNPNIKIGRTIPAESIRRLHEELHAQMPEASVELLQGLGGMSLKQQVALMQRTDVLLTVHGAELSNLIFMRRGASLVELFPFGYHSRWFKRLINAAGVTHAQVIAKPEKKRFLDCVNHKAPKLWPNLSPDVMQRVKDKYMKHVRMWDRATTDAERHNAGSFSDKAHVMQVCARGQRIFIDPVKIAAIAVEEARKKCGVN